MMPGLALIPSSVLAQQQATTLRQQLVGTWEYVSLTPPSDITGANPKGQLILGGSGRYITASKNPSRPKGSERTVNGFAANFGTWSVNETDKTVTFHVEGAVNLSIEGTDGKSTISLNGDELKLTSSVTNGTAVYKRIRAVQ
jgi:hypothetical protein